MVKLPDVIDAYIAAYNDKDVPAMLACLAEDVRFRNVSGGTTTAQTAGKPAFAELAAFGASAFTTRRQHVTNAITVAGVTAVEIDYSAVVATNLPNGWTAGQALSFSGASLFEVADGTIVSIVDES